MIVKALIAALAIAIATAGVQTVRLRHVQEAAQVAAAAQAMAIADAMQRAADVTTRVVTEYVDRVHVIVAQGETITKQVPVYVTREADARCVVPRGFVRVHNAAAQGVLPGAAASTDAAASRIALSAVATTVASNYTACRATAARLTALQAWARGVSEVSQ